MAIDSDVLRVFVQIARIIKMNNIYNINTLTDFYTLQVMVLENELKQQISSKEKLFHILKLKDESNNSKEEEIAFLIERIRLYEEQMNNNEGNQMELFENELKIIRSKLIEKTNEFLNLENLHKEHTIKAKIRLTEVSQQQTKIVEDNYKMKEILFQLINSYKTGNEGELHNAFRVLINDNEVASAQSSVPVQPKSSNSARLSKHNELFDQFSDNNMNSQGNLKNDDEIIKTESELNETPHNQFVQKVISEFDKILNDEHKRVERYFNRDPIQRPSRKSSETLTSATKKKGSQKNYVEWKQRRGSANWMNSLRDAPINTDANKIALKVDIHSLAHVSKNKIKESITNIGKLYDNSFMNTKFEDEINKSSQEDFNYSQFYDNRMTKSFSPDIKNRKDKRDLQKEYIF